MDDIATQIEDALKTDFPNAKLAHKPFPANSGKDQQPTLSQQIDFLIAGLNSRIRILEKLRETL